MFPNGEDADTAAERSQNEQQCPKGRQQRMGAQLCVLRGAAVMALGERQTHLSTHFSNADKGRAHSRRLGQQLLTSSPTDSG